MAKAMKCDRCGILSDLPDIVSIWGSRPEDHAGFKVPAILVLKGNRQDLDLCTVCKLSFYDWWKSWVVKQAETKGKYGAEEYGRTIK